MQTTIRTLSVLKYAAYGTASLALFALSLAAHSAPFVLDSSIQCSEKNQENGIQINDVTGDLGGADDCWGTYDGNPAAGGNNSPQAQGFKIGDTLYSFVAKQDMPSTLTGVDIGLNVLPKTTEPPSLLSGTWSFDPNKFQPTSFLIVLKAANTPGFAVWLFDGQSANSSSGNWKVAWNQDLSNFSVYSAGDKTVPEPATLGMLGLGLLGMAALRRRKLGLKS